MRNKLPPYSRQPTYPFQEVLGTPISSSMSYSAPGSFPKDASDPASDISMVFFLEQVERASIKLTSLNIHKSMPSLLTVADCCGLCAYPECTMQNICTSQRMYTEIFTSHYLSKSSILSENYLMDTQSIFPSGSGSANSRDYSYYCPIQAPGQLLRLSLDSFLLKPDSSPPALQVVLASHQHWHAR